MRRNNNRKTWTILINIGKYLLVIFLFVGGVVLNIGSFYLNDPKEIGQKIICNLGSIIMLGWFVNLLTAMFFQRSETEKLAERVFDRLYSIVSQQITKAKLDKAKLSSNEAIILSHINEIIYSLEEFYDIDEYRDELFGRYRELLIRDFGQDIIALNITPPSTFENPETQIIYSTLHDWKDTKIMAASGSGVPSLKIS